MPMMKEGAAPRKPAAPSIDRRRQQMLALMDMQNRAPRVDRDLTPPPTTQYGETRQAPYKVPPFLQREPSYPFEDVDPMDLMENLSTLWDLKKKKDALKYRQQPMYRTPTYEVPVEPPIYKL